MPNSQLLTTIVPPGSLHSNIPNVTTIANSSMHDDKMVITKLDITKLEMNVSSVVLSYDKEYIEKVIDIMDEKELKNFLNHLDMIRSRIERKLMLEG